MVISCRTCQKEGKYCKWVKYLIYAVLSQFQICRNLRVFSDKSVFPKLQSSQKNVFFQVCSPNHKNHYTQTIRTRELTFFQRIFTSHHVSGVRCPVSRVTCQVLRVNCQMPHFYFYLTKCLG